MGSPRAALRTMRVSSWPWYRCKQDVTRASNLGWCKAWTARPRLPWRGGSPQPEAARRDREEPGPAPLMRSAYIGVEHIHRLWACTHRAVKAVARPKTTLGHGFPCPSQGSRGHVRTCHPVLPRAAAALRIGRALPYHDRPRLPRPRQRYAACCRFFGAGSRSTHSRPRASSSATPLPAQLYSARMHAPRRTSRRIARASAVRITLSSILSTILKPMSLASAPLAAPEPGTRSRR